MKKLMILVSSLLMFVNAQPASAAGVNAVAGETMCNQDVGNSTGVSAYRVASEFCVVEFRNVGSTTWTVPNGVTAIDYLVVAGGGGGAGGIATAHGGGGGGAGGFRTGTYSISSSPISIVVGGGGAGGAGSAAGTNGSNSSLGGSVISTGGGGGGTYYAAGPSNGGSGGGAGASNTFLTGGNGTGGQGNNGGNVTVSGSNGRHGAGGGGAGGQGGSTGSSGGYTITAGAGGIGASSSISGSPTTYAGGGGGGGSTQLAGGSGGASGGDGGGGTGASAGTSLTTAATSGTANTGSGGGGGVGYVGGASAGAAGGSGIIIIRYSLAPSNSASPSISGIVTYGETLTATNGSWLYTPTSYTYQWSRAATVGGTYSNITGARSATYNLVSADVGQFLKVTVTASNSGGSSAATSAATIAIPKTDKSASIAIQAGALVYRQSKQITATTTVPGKITFLANGKRIAGCISKRVSSANSYTAVCNYRPSVRGQITISTTFVPDDSFYSGKVSNSEKLNVGHRVSNR